MLVGLIAGRPVDGAELAFAGHTFLQLVGNVVSFKPAFRAAGDRERAGQGDEQQNAFHPLILGSERPIARMTIGRETANVFP
jgi:hypothetical protein